MTVGYMRDVNSVRFSLFTKLCLRWRGSIWKAVYAELLVWLILYGLIHVFYLYILSEHQQLTFEQLCTFFKRNRDFVPLTFMLGFFVSIVLTRWWNMYQNIGWIDTVALTITNLTLGDDEAMRMARRNMVRHMLFFQVLVYRDVCITVRERFPTMETLVVAGYLTRDELDHFETMESQYCKYYMPVNWVMSALAKLRREGKVDSDEGLRLCYDRIMAFRYNLGTLLMHDTTPVPLLYTQVVCIVVRLYFLIALLGTQSLELNRTGAEQEAITMYVPVLTIFQFMFYIGWLKVAEALLNPFGGDDDDFEINWLIDRNMEVGYNIANKLFEPPLVKDIYWDTKIIEPLYNLDSKSKGYNPVQQTFHDEPIRAESITMVPRLVDMPRRFSEVPVYVDRSISVAQEPDTIRNIFSSRRMSQVPSLGSSRKMSEDVDPESPIGRRTQLSWSLPPRRKVTNKISSLNEHDLRKVSFESVSSINDDLYHPPRSPNTKMEHELSSVREDKEPEKESASRNSNEQRTSPPSPTQPDDPKKTVHPPKDEHY